MGEAAGAFRMHREELKNSMENKVSAICSKPQYYIVGERRDSVDSSGEEGTWWGLPPDNHPDNNQRRANVSVV